MTDGRKKQCEEKKYRGKRGVKRMTKEDTVVKQVLNRTQGDDGNNESRLCFKT